MIKILHQTWKTKDIPTDLFPNRWLSSWSRDYPDWDINLWDDKDCLKFMEKYYPDYLPMYQDYNFSIERADAFRYFVLHKYGGLYVDLDCESLKPIDSTIKNNSILLGREPEENTLFLYNIPLIVSNAIMYSEPGHPFWLLVFKILKERAHINKIITNILNSDILNSTGPRMLTEAYEIYTRHKTEPIPIMSDTIMAWKGHIERFYPGTEFNINMRIPGKNYSILHYNKTVWTK